MLSGKVLKYYFTSYIDLLWNIYLVGRMPNDFKEKVRGENIVESRKLEILLPRGGCVIN